MKIKEFFTNKDDGNIAFHTTKNILEVEQNRINIAKKYGFNLSNLRYMEQTHKNNVEIITQDSPTLIKNCDAIITNIPNIPLMVMVADCIPIFLKDDKLGVISAIHAGRNSTFLQIVSKTAKIFLDEFGSNKDDIKAIFGPSIQKCCYEVSYELANIAKNSFGEEFVNNRNIDLQGINESLLKKLEIDKISKSTICTHCSNENYFSYRKNKNCGRFAGIIQKEE